MIIRIIGAALTVVSCGAFGYAFIAAHRREVHAMQQLLGVLELVECDLRYQRTPLPDLCRYAASLSSGCIEKIFTELAEKLELQICPNVDACLTAVLRERNDIPVMTIDALRALGKSLGKFDADGQVKAINSVVREYTDKLQHLCKSQDIKLRSYQTLSICAGAALVILFI